MKNIIFFFLFLAQSALAENVRSISVSGMAEKSFEPDMARIQVSLWGKADNAKSAQNLSNGQYEQFKKTIESYGVKAVDVQTTGYELSPDYTYDNKTNVNKITGYTANQMIRVTIRKVSSVGKFLDEITSETKNTKSGTTVQNVGWDLEKRDEIEKDLLAEAVKSAESKAELLAKAAKVKIKNLNHLVPQSSGTPIPMFEGMAMKAAAPRGDNSTALFAGEVKVQASVSADYEIE